MCLNSYPFQARMSGPEFCGFCDSAIETQKARHEATKTLPFGGSPFVDSRTQDDDREPACELSDGVLNELSLMESMPFSDEEIDEIYFEETGERWSEAA